MMTMNNNESEIQERIDQMAQLEAACDGFEHVSGDCWDKLETERREGYKTGWGPLVGMPATYCIGSDTYAGKVVDVSKTGKVVTVSIGNLEYEFTRRKDGAYRSKGISVGYLRFLVAKDYRCPEF